jgi:hypothetical protein
METFENAYPVSCFIAKVMEKLYLWFMFQLMLSSSLCFKLWHFNIKIDFHHNTIFFRILINSIIASKCQSLNFFFFFCNLRIWPYGDYINFFCHVQITLGFAQRTAGNVVNCFHETNIKMSISWSYSSICDKEISSICNVILTTQP